MKAIVTGIEEKTRPNKETGEVKISYVFYYNEIKPIIGAKNVVARGVKSGEIWSNHPLSPYIELKKAYNFDCEKRMFGNKETAVLLDFDELTDAELERLNEMLAKSNVQAG